MSITNCAFRFFFSGINCHATKQEKNDSKAKVKVLLGPPPWVRPCNESLFSGCLRGIFNHLRCDKFCSRDVIIHICWVIARQRMIHIELCGEDLLFVGNTTWQCHIVLWCFSVSYSDKCVFLNKIYDIGIIIHLC